MSVRPYLYNFSFYISFADYQNPIGHHDLGHSTGKQATMVLINNSNTCWVVTKYQASF